VCRAVVSLCVDKEADIAGWTVFHRRVQASDSHPFVSMGAKQRRESCSAVSRACACLYQ